MATLPSDMGCVTCGSGKALERCGRCKNAHYCSKACHTKDWPLHKAMCKRLAAAAASIAPPGTTSTIVSFHLPKDSPLDLTFTSIFMRTLPGMNQAQPPCCEALGGIISGSLQNRRVELPLTHALGFPIFVAICSDPEATISLPNLLINILSFDPDPRFKGFAQPTLIEIHFGKVCLMRCDRRPEVHIETLGMYALYGLEEFLQIRYLVAVGKEVDREGIANKLLNPKAFAAYFATMDRSWRRRSDGKQLGNLSRCLDLLTTWVCHALVKCQTEEMQINVVDVQGFPGCEIVALIYRECSKSFEGGKALR
ncbi:hypothetical protein LTR86_002803 [Recurvomyces mirabilis]|nr:hypothetical protein LTR86_002803 [Recurvomyces mirabilis]